MLLNKYLAIFILASNNSEIYFSSIVVERQTKVENYRNSDLFRNIWAKTKPMFNNKPLAWSVDKIVSLP